MPTTSITVTGVGPSAPIPIKGFSAAFSPGAYIPAEILPPAVYATVTNPWQGGVAGANSNIGFVLEYTADQPDAKGNWNPQNWVPENIGSDVSGYMSSFQKLIKLRATGVRANIFYIANGATLVLQVIE